MPIFTTCLLYTSGDIINYTCENLSSAALYYDDAAANAYLTLKLYGEKKYRNIKQVVIDEAQDYYPLHYEIFNLLFPNAKFTILGDINQTLEKQEDLCLLYTSTAFTACLHLTGQEKPLL